MRIVAFQAITIDGLLYLQGQEIPPEVWLRLPKRERDRLENLGKVKLE